MGSACVVRGGVAQGAVLRLGVYGASGRQGQRYLDPANWPSGIECYAIARGSHPKCDGVVVATPPGTHLEVSKLACGIPLLVEKPIALTLDDASKIANRGTPVLVAHTHLWHSKFLALEPNHGAAVTWCGPEREDGSCPAALDWGAHAWSMAIALGTERVTTGVGDRQTNAAVSRGQRYASLPSAEERPMRAMLATFATLIQGGSDWRAAPEYTTGVLTRCFKPYG